MTTLSHRARFRIQYDNTELSLRLFDFVGRAGQLVAGGRSLADAARLAFEQFPTAAQFFAEPLDRDDVLHLRDDVMFAQWRPSCFEYTVGERGNRLAIGEHPWRAIDTLRSILNGRFAEAEEHPAGRSLVRELQAADAFGAPAPSSSIDFSRDGIYRLQHASVLVRHRGVGVLVDPHLHSGFTIDFGADITLHMLEPFVDAIALTHPHEDHMYLTTLLMFDRDLPVIVPPAAGNSIVSCDMVQLLTSAGFANVVAPAWWGAPVRIGDILVHALPFYGEQILVDAPIPNAAFRNAASTYLFEAGGSLTWLLIDSGREYLGSMWEVADGVFRRFGSVDTVLSNLSEFTIFGPYYINSGLNWLCLSADDKARLPSMKDHLMTLGPSGVAAVCTNARARRYAPYAHWWGPVRALGGTSGGTSDQELFEARQVARLRAELSAVGAATKIVDWSVGDSIRL